MDYSWRIPLWFGQLKIKSETMLRNYERERKVPVWQVGAMNFVWMSHDTRKTLKRRKSPPSF